MSSITFVGDPSYSSGIMNHDQAESTTPMTDNNNAFPTPISALSTARPSQSEVPQGSVLQSIKKRSVTILLIGETGSGKTSFMSFLSNLLKGNSPFELSDYHDRTCDSGLPKNQTQTIIPKLYTIEAWGGTKFQVLDTPGLADIRGVDIDNQHKANINKAIKELVTSIDAVMVLANGTTERLTLVTDYALKVISTLFPKSIVDNIGFIFTNSQSHTLNFRVESLQPELQNAKRWALQNPLAVLKTAPSLTNKQLHRMHAQLPVYYEEAVETLNDWLAWLDERHPQETLEIERLFQISTNIESQLEAALFALTQLSQQRAEYNRICKDLHNSRKQKVAMEELEQQQEKQSWGREDTEKTNTICLYTGCNSNCHMDCQGQIEDDPKSIGRWCKVFKTWRLPVGGIATSCAVCTHQASEHRRYQTQHVQRSSGDPEVLQKLKNAQTVEDKLAEAKEVAAHRLEDIDHRMTTARSSIETLIEEFHGLALSQSFVGHIRSAMEVLEMRKKDLNGYPNQYADEIKLIDISIRRLKAKLDLVADLQSRSSSWGNKAWSTVSNRFNSS